MRVDANVSIYVKVTERCNTRCLHCYNAYGQEIVDLDVATYQGLMDRIGAYFAKANWSGRVEVIITGGEPLLVPVERLVKIVSISRGALSAIDSLGIGLQSNCLIYNDEIRGFIKRYVSDVGTSFAPGVRFLDGNYPLWESNVVRMVKDGARLHLIVVLSKYCVENVFPSEVLKLILDVGFCSFSVEEISRRGRAKQNWDRIVPDRDLVDEWVARLIDEFIGSKAYHLVDFKEVSSFGLIADDADRIEKVRLYMMENCNDGKKVISINADGSVVTPDNNFTRMASDCNGVEELLDFALNDENQLPGVHGGFVGKRFCESLLRACKDDEFVLSVSNR